MSIKRLFDAVERRGDIGRRVATLFLPISNRARVTSSCASKLGLREPGKYTSGPNLASRDNVAHKQNYIRFWNVTVLYQLIDSAKRPWPTNDCKDPAGASRSDSAGFGRSQKDGLPSRPRGEQYGSRPFNSRTREGQPSRCPFLIGSRNGPQGPRPCFVCRPVALLCRFCLDCESLCFQRGVSCARCSCGSRSGREALALTFTMPVSQ